MCLLLPACAGETPPRQPAGRQRYHLIRGTPALRIYSNASSTQYAPLG
jgi:hypothetical protein